MRENKRGKSSYVLPTKPRIAGYASVVGPKEGQGPLGHTFDERVSDDTLGKSSWEQAEKSMLARSVELAMSKSGVYADDVDALLGGDLLNQIVSTAYTARDLGMPFLGLYGACSTMAESLLLGAMMIDGGYANNVICTASSHFSTAERQYRFPLEMGAQRTPTAQRTVTGSGATLLSASSKLPLAVTSFTIGRVRDFQQTDMNNMGAAMAPAACDTLMQHFSDLQCGPQDYDRIVTGDLGCIGHTLLKELCAQKGLRLDQRYIDCGCEIFKPEQDVHAGGSGCGCSAVCLNGWLLGRMRKGEIRRMLFLATGALMSPTTSQQGESIPGIAHAVSLEVI